MKTNKFFKLIAVVIIATTLCCTVASVASAGLFDIFKKNDKEISFITDKYSTDTDFYTTDTDFVTRTDFTTNTDCDCDCEENQSIFTIIFEKIRSWFRKFFVLLQLS